MHSARVDWAALVARLMVGGLMLFHGYHKISQGVEEGLAYVKSTLVAKDLPDVLAWGVYAGEIVAPVMLIIGLFVPLAGFAVSATMGMAIYLAHSHQLTEIRSDTGGYSLELQAFFLLGGLICMLLGSGRFSILGGKDKGPIAT